MNFISLSIILCSIHYVAGTNVMYESGYNQLTKRLLEIITDIAVEITVEEQWIEQPVDHFNETSTTWKMRYFQRLDLLRPDGPIFIYLGGEGEARKLYLTTGVTKELAEETGGALFMTEHRYYGKSKPFDNLHTENLKWLSSKQALADIANFIRKMKSKHTLKNSKVVVVGGSYAGNLAAWMRLKYPDLVDAAIASSAPVLAKKDFYEYLEKVNEDYEHYGTSSCLDTIEYIYKRNREMLQTQEGIDELREEYNICKNSNLTDTKDQWVFFSSNVSPYMTKSQYGGPKKIKEHCSYIDKFQKANITEGIKELFNDTDECYDVTFEGMIKSIRKSNSSLAWYYQVCTEFGYFQTTTSDCQPFGHVLPVEFNVAMCKELFGSSFDESRVDEGIEEVNAYYGGLTPNVTKVVFVNGDVDPWSTISVLEDLSYEAPAVVIHRATHCDDLFVTKDDPEELKEAQKHIKNTIKNWICVGDDPDCETNGTS